MSTKREISDLRSQIDDLQQQVSEWRHQLTFQEAIAFFAVKAEELRRRLNALEKRIAQQTDAEKVEIRFRAEPCTPVAG